MADDKVRELAEKTAGDTHHLMHYVAVNQAERILRAELKPLLDKTEHAHQLYIDLASREGSAADQQACMMLAAELEHWRTK